MKRKALEDHNINVEVPLQKKRRLPSATPQLQAFFNSHVQKPLPEEKLTPKMQSNNESPHLVALAEDNKLSETIDVGERRRSVDDFLSTTESANYAENADQKVHRAELSDNSAEIVDDTIQSTKIVTQSKEIAESAVHAETKSKANFEKKTDETRKKKIEKVSTNQQFSQDYQSSTQPQQGKKSTENVQFYQMLKIPVDEAVRSKPPTPVESPTNFCGTVAKRAIEPKKPFVQLHSTRDLTDVKSVKNRRKPIIPHHNVHIAPNPAPIDAQIPKPAIVGTPSNPALVESSLPPAGRFILLNPPHSSSNYKVNQSGSETIKARAITPYSRGGLSHAQAHQRALEAVRNMGKLQTEKRPVPLKRPILPKTSNTPHVLNKSITSSTSVTRNIFQNEKVTYPMTSLSKPPARVVGQSRTTTVTNNGTFIPGPKQSPEFLLKQMAAAATGSDKTNVVSSKSRPPPPYTISNFVSYPNPGQGSSTKPRSPISVNFSLHVSSNNNNLPTAPNMTSLITSMANQRQTLNPHSVKPRFSEAHMAQRARMSNLGLTHSAPNTIALLKSGRQPNRFPNLINPRPIAPHPGHLKKNNNATTVGAPRYVTAPNSMNKNISNNPSNRGPGADSRKAMYFTSSKSSRIQSVNRELKTANQDYRKHPSLSHLHGIAPGSSGAFCARASVLRPSKPESIDHRSAPVRPALSSMSSHGIPSPRTIRSHVLAEKRKSNPVFRRSAPSPPVIPPLGTKSPWSPRGYSLSPVMGHTPEFATSSRHHTGYSPPPPAHQHGRQKRHIFTSSNEDDEQPLELTAKSRRFSRSPLVTAPLGSENASMTSRTDSDQPLCLIVKKH